MELNKTPNENNIEDASENIGKKTVNPDIHSDIESFNENETREEKEQAFASNKKLLNLGVFRNGIFKSSIKDEDASNAPIINVERYNPDPEVGLSDEVIEKRVADGLVNSNLKQYSKTYRQIFVNNILTFFNILCLCVAIALIYVKEYKNLSFLFILIINTVIGIVQEIKAKKTIDKLSIVTAPTAIVIRDSKELEIPVSEIVLDDITKLKNGKQIAADCIVVQGEVEVNESLITGESVAIKKTPGDTLLAGSFITSGSCLAKVDKVGHDCYIQRLQAKAKKYTKPKSELLKSLKVITTFITIVIIPLGTIVGIRNYQGALKTVQDPTFGTSGSLVVYGYDSTTKNQYKIGEIDRVLSNEDTTFSLNTIESDNTIPNIDYIVISYDKKSNGNIAISGVKVEEAIKDGNNNITRSTLTDWHYNDSSTDTYSYSNSVSKYLDGSLKLDATGDFFRTMSFKESNQLFISVTLQSRGYGYDDLPEEQEVIHKEVIKQTVTKTAGSLIGMIPTGLFLLVTIALAVSVVKLAKSKTLVQELYCIEMLARVDCICLDKTGTITDGTMRVKEVIDVDINYNSDSIMGAYVGALEDNNLTSIALQDRFGVNFDYKKIKTLPFSSQRKLSAAQFEDIGTFILGAPEFVYKGKSKKILALVDKKTAMGYRVLMLAHSDKPIENDKVPADASPVSIIILEDHIRPEAYDTINWFKENGVAIKVISGDNPATVAEIAGKVGIENAGDYISLEGLSPKEVETVATEYTVFGRVTPDQKAILIKTLKIHGKTVAMTGDGVNDILAMKESDCSVAMASGSEAARNVAHLVLLDSNFSNMPKVVLEGRRVINNIQSASSLYLMKTLFVMAITLLSIVATSLFAGYPFEPIQFMLLEFFIIGLPSTILALQPNKDLIKGNFIANIIANCVTQALCLIASVVVIYIFKAKAIYGLDLSNADVANSIAVMAITYVGFVILCNICRPFNTLRALVCVGVGICITTAFSVPEISSFFLAYQFKELPIACKLFLFVVVLGCVPLERFFADQINKAKELKKKEHVNKELREKSIIERTITNE